MPVTKMRLVMAAMGQPKARVFDLCRGLGVTWQTLCRHVSPNGALCDGQNFRWPALLDAALGVAGTATTPPISP
jgi:hypothetical protein